MVSTSGLTRAEKRTSPSRGRANAAPILSVIMRVANLASGRRSGQD